jgi:hypothetical protein
MKSIDYERLFLLGWGPKPRALHVKKIPSDPDPDDPYYRQTDSSYLFKGKATPKKPVAYEYDSGRFRWDQIGTVAPVLSLYSARIIDVLTENEFTGWRPFPVTIRGKSGRLIKGYSGISILGRAGNLDDTRSETVLLPPLYEGGPDRPGLRGFYFEDDVWDGSDVFTCENAPLFLCSLKVKEAISALNPTNIVFTSLTEYEYR